MNRILNYFIQGALYIVPLAVTIYVIYLIFNFIDGLLDETLLALLKIDIPGLGLVVIVLILVLVGLIGQTIIARPIKTVFNRVMDKTPLLKLIYSAFNDLFSAFAGKEKKFNKPVIVLINPSANIEKLGFLTEEDLSKINEKEKVAVYFPHSYGFTGELFVVPGNQVRSLSVNSASLMKFILSGGVSGLEESN